MISHLRPIQPTPPRIVENGEIQAGYFTEPFADVNLLDARLFGGKAMRWARWMRLKEWVGFGLTHPDAYLSMIIQDAKYLGSSAIYVFDRRTQQLSEHACARPGRSVEIAPTPWQGRCRIERPGYLMEFDHQLRSEGLHRIRIDIRETRSAPAIRGELTLSQDLKRVDPLVVSAPVRPRHSLYTHKTLMPVSGELRIGADSLLFDPARDLANLDEHKAFYPYHTEWRWMTFGAFDAQGRILGLNLSEHMMKDEDQASENCAWLDGRISLLGGARFRFDEKSPMNPWQISEKNGRVALTFQPEGRKLEERHFGLARIRYYQLCGRFQGMILDDQGRRHEVSDFYGVCEQMDTHF